MENLDPGSRQGAQQSVLEGMKEIGRSFKQLQLELIAVISQRTKDAAEQRRWMIVQAIAIVGFVVPLLLSQAAVLPVANYVRVGAALFIAALGVLFTWDIVDEFYADAVLSAAMTQNKAAMDKGDRRRRCARNEADDAAACGLGGAVRHREGRERCGPGTADLLRTGWAFAPHTDRLPSRQWRADHPWVGDALLVLDPGDAPGAYADRSLGRWRKDPAHPGPPAASDLGAYTLGSCVTSRPWRQVPDVAGQAAIQRSRLVYEQGELVGDAIAFAALKRGVPRRSSGTRRALQARQRAQIPDGSFATVRRRAAVRPSVGSLMDFAALPGGDLVAQGLDDLSHGRETVAALLVLAGAPRLRRIGIAVPATSISLPEHRLYELLAAVDEDAAYSQYNALIRRLVSFMSAAECVR